MGAVAAGIGAQVAVFVVEHLVDVDVEDVLPVGQRSELLIEAVDAGVIERRVRARARRPDVQIRLDIDDGVRLRGTFEYSGKYVCQSIYGSAFFWKIFAENEGDSGAGTGADQRVSGQM